MLKYFIENIFKKICIVIPSILLAIGLTFGVTLSKLGINKPSIFFAFYNFLESNVVAIAGITISLLFATCFLIYTNFRNYLFVSSAFLILTISQLILVILSVASFLLRDPDVKGLFHISPFFFGIILAELSKLLIHFFKLEIHKTIHVSNILLVLVSIFALFFRTQEGSIFTFSNYARWSGPWRNPNTFGVFMAISIVIITYYALKKQKSIRDTEPKFFIFYFGSCILLLYACIHSFSRSAILLLILGILYLLSVSRFKIIKLVKEKWQEFLLITLGFVAIILFFIIYLDKLDAIEAVGKRYLVFDPSSDLSIKHRIWGWHGSIAMISEKPFLGWGWGYNEIHFAIHHNYGLKEHGAIATNSYFMLGVSSGFFSLFFCVLYLLFTGILINCNTANSMNFVFPKDINTLKRLLQIQIYIKDSYSKPETKHIVLCIVIMLSVMAWINPVFFSMELWPILCLYLTYAHVLIYESHKK